MVDSALTVALLGCLPLFRLSSCSRFGLAAEPQLSHSFSTRMAAILVTPSTCCFLSLQARSSLSVPLSLVSLRPVIASCGVAAAWSPFPVASWPGSFRSGGIPSLSFRRFNCRSSFFEGFEMGPSASFCPCRTPPACSFPSSFRHRS